jgi:hypothetical protein
MSQYKGSQKGVLKSIDNSDLRRHQDISESAFDLVAREAKLGIWEYNVASDSMSIVKGFNDFIEETGGNRKMSSEKWISNIFSEDIAMVRWNFKRHLIGKTEEYRDEYRILGKDRIPRWVQVFGTVIERDDNGVGTRMVGTIIDIDSTKSLAREVSTSKHWLQTIIDNIDSLVFVKDSNDRYLFVNKSFTSAFGFTMEQAIGKTAADLNVKMNSISVDADKYVLKNGISQTFEQDLVHIDGNARRYLTSKIPISNSDGDVFALVGLATDISRMKELENTLRDNMLRLDAAVNGTGNGSWDWNLKEDKLVLNDNWFRMLGYTRYMMEKRYTTFGHSTFVDLVHPEDMIKVQSELDKHFAKETDYYRVEIRLRTADGRWKWILAAGKVFEWADDESPVRMVGIHTDINDRVLMEEQLKVAKVKAEESDRLKSAFLANMSHEIRTPMNGIIGFIDLMDDDDLSMEQRKEYMTIVRKSTSQLLNIVNDIIDISRIEAGQIIVQLSDFNLSELFDEISGNYSSLLSGGDITFISECNIGESDINIKCDPTKLKQVLTNLISNAIKFTSKGIITVTCELVDEIIQFCVKDTGTGIEPEFHQTVFERFRQANNSSSRKFEGTGLGLSISKAYVEKMGGKIWLESVPGVGSSFYFNIPKRIESKEKS